MRPRLVVALICLAAVVGCGGGEGNERAPSELVGVIVAVEPSTGPVRTFTLEAAGESYRIFVAADVDYGFDLHHLRDHRATGDPVRCTLEERGDRLYALTILDA
jgi:hypothetical protein